MKSLKSVVVWWCCLLLVGCGAGGERAEARLRVFAAASLTEAFEALVDGFGARHPEVAVELHCAGTPQLVLQIREGAPVDVFASADAVQMQRVVEFATTLGEPQVFATNRLAIAVPAGNPHGIAGLADLARDDLRVLLCGPDVPAGRYARQVLERAGVAVRSVSDEPSVKSVVTKLLLGEVDAGIVYATDVAAAGAALTSVAIPSESGVAVAYPIVTLAQGASPETATAFVDFVRSDAGQRILVACGFEAP